MLNWKLSKRLLSTRLTLDHGVGAAVVGATDGKVESVGLRNSEDLRYVGRDHNADIC
jgi:hypothetical protein